MPNFKPTDEQTAVLAGFAKLSRGQLLVIRAFAGASKTTTLELLSKSRKESYLYVSFNRSIAEAAAQRFPEWVVCKTGHQLAYGYCSAEGYYNTKLTGSLTGKQIADCLGITSFQISNELTIPGTTAGYLIAQSIRRFCQSDDRLISPHHIFIPDFIRALDDEAAISRYKAATLQNALLIWGFMQDKKHALPLSHDGYFKRWALARPILQYDTLLLDEMQDTAPVMQGMMLAQLKAGAKAVFVGDTFQQIYEWRGAVDALETAAALPQATSLYLTRSFRFGPAIGELATTLLAHLGNTVPVIGGGSYPTKIYAASDAPEIFQRQTIICRKNATLIQSIMDALLAGLSVHVIGGTKELEATISGWQDLCYRRNSSHSMFLGFTSELEYRKFVEETKDTEGTAFLRLIDKFAPSRLMDALAKCRYTKESEARRICTTAHKSKGREWDNVLLANDFQEQPIIDEKTGESYWSPAETRLLYVACTRAKETLILPDWLAAYAPTELADEAVAVAVVDEGNAADSGSGNFPNNPPTSLPPAPESEKPYWRAERQTHSKIPLNSPLWEE